MALGKKAYPKATVKKIIKAHSNHNIKKNADVTVRDPKTDASPILSALLTHPRYSLTTYYSWIRAYTSPLFEASRANMAAAW